MSTDAPPLAEFLLSKIREAQHLQRLKTEELQRIEVQRNVLNKQVQTIEGELSRLGREPSSVGEVCKLLGRSRVLVKQGDGEGKIVVELEKRPPGKSKSETPELKISDLKPGTRVSLRPMSMNYAVHAVLPQTVDPLVQLMEVEKNEPVAYDEIGGCEKQIREVREVVELPIKHPELFDALGIQQPKGVLMYGPPGTGKTMVARAVATQCDAKFIRLVGSELVQKYIGEGSRLVRDIFQRARAQAPAIIFMDEVDTIGSSRGSGESQEVQRTMMELLNQLDGFEPASNIKVLMATNRIDVLDSALLRPGRIDRKVEFPAPDEDGRLAVLKIHSRRMNLVRGIDLRKVAKDTPKASGAELRGICMEAGMYALRERRVHVTQEDFTLAVSKVIGAIKDTTEASKRLWT